jgi:hypothetical protein
MVSTHNNYTNPPPTRLSMRVVIIYHQFCRSFPITGLNQQHPAAAFNQPAVFNTLTKHRLPSTIFTTQHLSRPCYTHNTSRIYVCTISNHRCTFFYHSYLSVSLQQHRPPTHVQSRAHMTPSSTVLLCVCKKTSQHAQHHFQQTLYYQQLIPLF